MSTLSEGVSTFPSLLQSIFTQESEAEKKEKPEEELIKTQLIMQVALEAMNAYQQGNLEMFCPPVGDEACQIRALQTFTLSEHGLTEQVEKVKILAEKNLEILSTLKANFQVLDQLSKKGGFQAHLRFPDSKQEKRALQNEWNAQSDSLKKDLLQKSLLLLDIPVDSRILFLTRTCLLSNAYSQREDPCGGYKDHEDVNKLVKLANPEEGLKARLNTACELMIKDAKRIVNQQSVSFVQKQAALLQSEEALTLRQICATPKKVQKTGSLTIRQELPCTFMTRVIFNRAKELKAPILLKIRSLKTPLTPDSYVFHMLFYVNSDGKYESVFPLEKKESVKTLVVEAYSNKTPDELESTDFQKELFESGKDLLNIIDLNTAQHRQYTDQDIEPKKDIFQEIEGLCDEKRALLERKMDEAIEKGFSPKNPELCAIDHIFCSTLGIQKKGSDS